jgi:hypothetical protein
MLLITNSSLFIILAFLVWEDEGLRGFKNNWEVLILKTLRVFL